MVKDIDIVLIQLLPDSFGAMLKYIRSCNNFCGERSPGFSARSDFMPADHKNHQGETPTRFLRPEGVCV